MEVYRDMYTLLAWKLYDTLLLSNSFQRCLYDLNNSANSSSDIVIRYKHENYHFAALSYVTDIVHDLEKNYVC